MKTRHNVIENPKRKLIGEATTITFNVIFLAPQSNNRNVWMSCQSTSRLHQHHSYSSRPSYTHPISKIPIIKVWKCAKWGRGEKSSSRGDRYKSLEGHRRRKQKLRVSERGVWIEMKRERSETAMWERKGEKKFSWRDSWKARGEVQ